VKVVLATDARTRGGVGRHLGDLAGGLLRRGAEVSFAAPGGSRIAELAAALGAEFRAFEDGVHRADVWHLHLADTYDRGSFRALGRARLTSRRVVVTEHLPRNNASDPALTGDPRTPGAATAKTGYKRVQLGLAHSVLAVSEASRRFLLRRYRLPAGRVVTVHNGVDLDRFHPHVPASEPAGPPLVVAVGSLIRQKGLDVLIRAAARANRPWHVVVAGAGPQLESLRSLADEAAPGRIEFRGWVDDVPGLMRSATVVCLPSRWESFAYVPLEAMALGVPLVGARVDGVDELVTHERSGLLVEPEDPAALAAAVDRIAADPELARRLAGHGRATASGFGLDRMVDRTLSHYRSLL
jgi:glycosyltransferase involved in cell wall biosynthesis